MNKKSFWLYVVIMIMAVIAVVLAIFILVVTDNKKPSNQHFKEEVSSQVTKVTESEEYQYVLKYERDTLRIYRNIDSPTDVLSFPGVNYVTPSDFDAIEDELENNAEDYFNPDTGELLLGDIVLCVQKIKEQADKYGHSEKRELAFLTAHSMMHLFGYDHMTPEESAVMEAKQNEVLERLGITR